MLTFSIQNISCVLNLQGTSERKQFFCAMNVLVNLLKTVYTMEKKCFVKEMGEVKTDPVYR